MALVVVVVAVSSRSLSLALSLYISLCVALLLSARLFFSYCCCCCCCCSSSIHFNAVDKPRKYTSQNICGSVTGDDVLRESFAPPRSYIFNSVERVKYNVVGVRVYVSQMGKRQFSVRVWRDLAMSVELFFLSHARECRHIDTTKCSRCRSLSLSLSLYV